MIRDQIVENIIKEVCGPDPHPAYIHPETGEEILLEKVHGSPKLRYGAGMLYPQATNITELDEASVDFDDSSDIDGGRGNDDLTHGSSGSLAEDGDSDNSIGLANEFLPSAMGLTCKLRLVEGEILVSVKSAWYERSETGIAEKRVDDAHYVDKTNRSGDVILRRNWTRRPIIIEDVVLDISSIGLSQGLVHESVLATIPWEEDRNWLVLKVFNRSRSENLEKGECILTFTIVNQIIATSNQTDTDRYILYQNELSLSDNSENIILPYDERVSVNDTEEEEELKLLYREKKSYAIGHGCSVRWDESSDSINRLSTSVIPVYELPQVSPTQHVTLSMFELSDLGNWANAKSSLNHLIYEYESWINSLETSLSTLDEKFRTAAFRNITKCRSNLSRIKGGVELLLNSDIDSDIVRCFRWMNRAMIWQQQRSKTQRRNWIRDGRELVLEPIVDGFFQHPSLEQFNEGRYNGNWRPFQIAFVLMNLIPIWNKKSEQREIVDLIWFPTGGGKTEAYLGLAAFTIFARRIRAKDGMMFQHYSGTSILMRYTLRLLTSQQYERASSLICACELIRQEEDNMVELGPDPISIGLWVGGGSTPNKRKEANQLFRELTGRNAQSTEYNLIVMKCPCCGAAIGKVESPPLNRKIMGIAQTDGNVSSARTYFTCDNTLCEFHQKELPLYVVDEDIFDFCPTLVLGTVDKFAMIPWQPSKSSRDLDAGKLFGFRQDGNKHRIMPPELIIQDELHLISGPLGTMVGLYESLILTLCNDYDRNEYPFSAERFVPPKIIASSATISRASEQAKALYANEKLNIFPPQGILFGDTWFSEEKEPSLENPGRKYIGILTPGYRSAQTSVVRLYSSILQSVKSAEFAASDKDYYWTLLGFFNSIRELGMAASLIYADIREYMISLQNRKLIPFNDRRKHISLKELTSRMSSSEIPDALKELEKSYNGTDRTALDVCIATNMIATGVDVSRLGLMLIHGQPKTTAEYIQASSRVGRDSRGPGLVIMLYSPSKPRDKSLYEHFQSYHNKIYSYVEPTSVTPFSINARERALHSVIIGLVRHFSRGHFTRSPDISNNEPEFNSLINWVRNVVQSRCSIVDPAELENTMALFDRRVGFWRNGFQEYGDAANNGLLNQEWVPLMYSRGREVTEEIRIGGLSLPTQTSMRGVDEEGRIGILNLG